MESEREVTLEVDPVTIANIIAACIKLAAWCIEHKDEIAALVKKGWKSAQKIVNHLKQKYKKK